MRNLVWQVPALLRAKADAEATPSVIGPQLTGAGSEFLVNKLEKVRLEAGATERDAHVDPRKRYQGRCPDQGTGNDH